MKKILVLIILVIVFIGVVLFLFFNKKTEKIVGPIADKILEKPLDKYTYENLKKTRFSPSQIKIGKELKHEEKFASYVFYYNIRDKKVSGLLNVPVVSSNSAQPSTYPVIVMFRGFVPREIYTIGEGTRHSGEVFAQNGFVTLAPDFLGYGESDNPSGESIEERLETYIAALTLLNSITNLNAALKDANINIKADASNIGIWGHSNGGQIALSTLEITGATMPAVLWAPVSKPFPFSILAFTDDFDDHGKALRRVVADFEKNYDSEKYSPNNYYKWIKSPIQIHQGERDEAVPYWWSESLKSDLEKIEIPVELFIYPGLDHNFSVPTLWSQAVDRSIEFYRKEFEKR